SRRLSVSNSTRLSIFRVTNTVANLGGGGADAGTVVECISRGGRVGGETAPPWYNRGVPTSPRLTHVRPPHHPPPVRGAVGCRAPRRRRIRPDSGCATGPPRGPSLRRPLKPQAAFGGGRRLSRRERSLPAGLRPRPGRPAVAQLARAHPAVHRGRS